MIYFARHHRTGFIKIGCTKNLTNRVATLTKEYGGMTVLGLMDGNLLDEHALHRKFATIRDGYGKRFGQGILRGNEWFHPEPVLMEYIRDNTSMNFPLPFRGQVKTPRLPMTESDIQWRETFRQWYTSKERLLFVRSRFVALLRQKYGIPHNEPLPPKIYIAADIGLGVMTLQQWLRGRTFIRPRPEVVRKICEFLGCTVDELLPIERNDEQVKEPA